MTPFLQSTKAQGIINQYLNGDLNSTPNVNSAGVFRNPNFDLRTEQENAGTLDPSALYPNPQIDFSVPEEEIIDPCQEGFMLVDGICQPIETFGQSAYKEKDDKDDSEPREYYSIEDMEKMDDYEFLDYLTGAGAYMTGKNGQFTLNDPMNVGMFGSGLKLLGLDSSDIRNKFMKKKLTELGYNFTNNKQGEPIYNLQNPMQIIDNSQAANKLMTGDQQFDASEINYQIDAKNERDRTNDQQNYARAMTEQQVIEDAEKSGATSVNPFERFGLNQSTPSNYTSNSRKSDGNYRRNPNINNR